MEKSASSMSVVEGSTSTTTELIAVNIDPEVFCCPRCLHPLVPPVLQCAAGHPLCSSCHDDLPDKNRCVSCFLKTGYTRCFIPTTYTRCHGVERILRSLRVACPNAMHGCSAGKMLYQEKEEHEKTCPINLAPLKMGPVGGAGGDPMEMDVVRGIDRIVKVVVWHRDFTVDSMSVLYTYERDGREEQTEKWGRPAGECSEICLGSDEYLTCVKGHVGHQDSMFIVKSLTFVSNRHTFGPYGKEQGAPFELPAAGGRIVGFHGRSDRYLDALGTFVKMVV